jgi:hypothetical protein
VEEWLSFPEEQKRHFELQHKPVKVTYAQTAASCPLTSEISTQTVFIPHLTVIVQSFTPTNLGCKRTTYPHI